MKKEKKMTAKTGENDFNWELRIWHPLR